MTFTIILFTKLYSVMLFSTLNNNTINIKDSFFMILKQDENLNFKHEIFLIQIKIFVNFCSIINPL